MSCEPAPSEARRPETPGIDVPGVRAALTLVPEDVPKAGDVSISTRVAQMASERDAPGSEGLLRPRLLVVGPVEP